MSKDRLVGRDLGRYHVESLRGVGGMGAVYRARDTKLERIVALKVLPEQRAADDAFRQRFLRESKMLASIDHPNIVPVYEADEADGELYIAMRFVDGPELVDLVRRRGALPPAMAVSIISQIGDGLDYAHARGLVHRDVKPANILIVEGASADSPVHAYLADFGLTKIVGEGQGLTETGGFVGTSEYIAPEQIQGKGVDHRADIYSLGCVLYDMLTGVVPFPRDSVHALLWAHVNEPPPRPSRTRGDLPAGFDGVIAMAMAKDADQRYQTAGGLAHAAREALDSAPAAAGVVAAAGAVEPRRNASLPTEIRPAAAVVAADATAPQGEADALAVTDAVPTAVLATAANAPTDSMDPGATVVAAGAATVIAGGAPTVLATGQAGSPTEIAPPGGGGGSGSSSSAGGDGPPPKRRIGAVVAIAAGVAALFLAGSVLAVGTGGFGLVASATATPASARATPILPAPPTRSPDLIGNVVPSDAPSSSGSGDPPVPSDAPSDDPSAAPSDAPTKAPPTKGPPPTRPPDSSPPSGGAIRLDGGKSLTTDTTVKLTVSSKPSDRSSVTQMAISNSSSRPKGRPYDGSLNWKLPDKAGTRTVYVWFADSRGNWTRTPVKDTIYFDHPPVAKSGLYYNFSAATLADKTTITLDFFKLGLPIATDRDGQSTIRITNLWLKPSNTSYKSTLNSTGRQATMYIGAGYCGSEATYTYGFTVTDKKGVKDNGSFKLRVCY